MSAQMLTISRDSIYAIARQLAAREDPYSYSMWRATSRAHYLALEHYLSALHSTTVLIIELPGVELFSGSSCTRIVQHDSTLSRKLVLKQTLVDVLYRDKHPEEDHHVCVYRIPDVRQDSSTRTRANYMAALLAKNSVYYYYTTWTSMYIIESSGVIGSRRLTFLTDSRSHLQIVVGRSCFPNSEWILNLSASATTIVNLREYPIQEQISVLRLEYSNAVPWLDLLSRITSNHVFV